MNTGIRVCDAMTAAPVTVSPDMSLIDCAKMMAQHHVGSLVVKDGEKLAGIFTEQDVVRKGVTKDTKPSQLKARDVMETHIISITPESDIADAMQVMSDYNIRHLPVVAEGKMVGFITGKDILKLQPELFDMLADRIELREEERKLSARRIGE